jgi:hypothetical protein
MSHMIEALIDALVWLVMLAAGVVATCLLLLTALKNTVLSK